MSEQATTNEIHDWMAETPESIAARLEGVKSSLAQTRLTLGVMALISVMMLIASYNAYMSYDYDWIVDASREKNQLGDQNTVSRVLTIQGLKDWASSRTVNIALLGMRVSVDDVAVLGTSVLLVLSLWLMLITRQENETVGSLLSDTDTPRPMGRETHEEQERRLASHGQRWLIFHTVVANSVFVTVDDLLASIRSLVPYSSLSARTAAGKSASLSRFGFRFLRSFFFMFPVVTALLVFIVDRRSYFIPDPWEPGAGLPNWEHNKFFFWQSGAIFVVCWIALVACCWASRRYALDTLKVVRDYGRKLHDDLLSHVRGESV